MSESNIPQTHTELITPSEGNVDTKDEEPSSPNSNVEPREAGEPALANNASNNMNQETSRTDDAVGSAEKAKEPEEMDVLGNGKLIKKIIQAGKGRDTRPSYGDKITVTFSARLKDGPVVEKSDTLTFVLGDGDYLQAFDLCCSLMELDETAIITTDPAYAYGEIGRKPDIPPNAHMIYEIHLAEVHGSTNYAKMDIEERLMEADKKRERGNFHYSRTEYAGAINSYSKAIKVLDDQGESHAEKPEELQKLIDMRLKCYNNLAAAQLKVEIYDAAVKSCDSVLRIQPNNVKALFRKGKCLSSQGDVKEAIACMKRALKFEPESKIIHSELSRLTNRQKVQEERERAMYQRMMGQDNNKGDKKKSEGGWSNWAWAAGVAGAAVVVSIGITAYRYLHT